MTKAEIDTAVKARGADKLVGFVFDSGTRELFYDYEPEKIFISDNVMQFNHKDLNDVPFVTVVPTSVVVGMIFVNNVEDKRKINMRSALF